MTLVDLQALLRPIDPFYRALNIESQNLYNTALKKGLTYGGGAILTALQAGIRLFAGRIEALLSARWQKSTPDLVVSLIPNFNKVMFRALKAVDETIPYVTIMTDIADHPPHFWQEPQDQYIFCGSEMAQHQAYQLGFKRDRVLRTSGMILKPDFYSPIKQDRRSLRQDFGLDPDKTTALIMFGGNGSKRSLQIVKRLRKAGLPIQSIVMYGNNEALGESLRGEPDCRAIGFTDQVATIMELADFFIGKPGPGSISEALHKGLPVIVEDGFRTMPQEKYNALWIKENELGLTVSSFRQIVPTVAKLLEGDRLKRFRKNTSALNNIALYEIPHMLNQILEQNEAHKATQKPLSARHIYRG